MKILILGFQDKQELKEVMEDFIVEKDIYLFTVLCGGLNQNNSQINKSVTQQQTEDFGAPIEFISADTSDKLFYFMSQTRTMSFSAQLATLPRGEKFVNENES